MPCRLSRGPDSVDQGARGLIPPEEHLLGRRVVAEARRKTRTAEQRGADGRLHGHVDGLYGPVPRADREAPCHEPGMIWMTAARMLREASRADFPTKKCSLRDRLRCRTEQVRKVRRRVRAVVRRQDLFFRNSDECVVGASEPFVTVASCNRTLLRIYNYRKRLDGGNG